MTPGGLRRGFSLWRHARGGAETPLTRTAPFPDTGAGTDWLRGAFRDMRLSSEPDASSDSSEAAAGETLSAPTSPILWGAVGILAAALLLAPAIWNGFPLLEYDTGGYLARWFEGYLVPSRPAAYGLLLAAAARYAFWPVLVL